MYLTFYRIAAFFIPLLFVACGSSSDNSPSPQTLSFPSSAVNIIVGDSLSHTATAPGSGKITYTSSNPDVVLVDSLGEITAKSVGIATITATIAADRTFASASAKYTVTTRALTNQSIAFERPGTITLQIGEASTNAATGGEGSGAITYTSTDSAIATVTEAGTVNALSDGTVTITARKPRDSSFYEATASYELKVLPGKDLNVYAWIGTNDTLLTFKGSAKGTQLYSTNNLNCYLSGLINCTDSATTIAGNSIVSTATSLTKPGHYFLQKNNGLANLTISNGFFSFRKNHQVTEFNGALWLVGGEEYNGTLLNDVWRSNDGRLWEQVNPNAEFSPRRGHILVVLNNKLFLIGGYDGEYQNDIWSSVDGIQWTQEAAHGAFGLTSTGGNYMGAQYGGLNVVASNNRLWLTGLTSTSKRELWSSSDGVNWNRLREDMPFPNSEFFSFTTFDGKLLMYPGLSKGSAWSSEDGINWVGHPTSIPSRVGHTFVTYNNKIWLIGGTRAGDIALVDTSLWSSADGINWVSSEPRANFRQLVGHQAAGFQNRLWVIGGYDRYHSSTYYRNENIWSSADGNLWVPETPGINTPISQLSQMTWMGDRWWLLEDSIYGKKIYSSRDGVNWSTSSFDELTPNFSGDVNIHLIAFDNQLWRIATFQSSGQHLWTSKDGITWTPRQNPPFNMEIITNVYTFNNKLFFIGLEDNIQYIFRSVDGNNWTQEKINPGFSPRLGEQIIEFKNKLWLLGGTDAWLRYGDGSSSPPTAAELGNEVWSSTDGANWTLENSATGFPPRSHHKLVVYNEKLWAIGGQTGKGKTINDVWSSVDGKNWVQQTAAANFSPRTNHHVIVQNNRLLLIGGYEGTLRDSHSITRIFDGVTLNDIWMSTDGIEWRKGFNGVFHFPE